MIGWLDGACPESSIILSSGGSPDLSVDLPFVSPGRGYEDRRETLSTRFSVSTPVRRIWIPTSEWMDEWIVHSGTSRIGEWIPESMNERIHESIQTNEGIRVQEWMITWIQPSTNGSMNGCIHESKTMNQNIWTNRWLNENLNLWLN